MDNSIVIMARLLYNKQSDNKSESFRRGKDRWVLSDESMPPACFHDFGKDLTYFFCTWFLERNEAYLCTKDKALHTNVSICQISSFKECGEDEDPLFFV